MKILAIILAIIALGGLFTAHYLYDANKEARARIEQLEKTVSEISDEKDKEIGQIKNTYDELVTDMQKEIEQGQVKITQATGRLSVSLIDKILFPSGEANITPEGVQVLKRVGQVIKEAQGQTIRVEGHTDNVPIHFRLRYQFPTNWELSTSRATHVVRFFQEQIGIDGKRLQAIGMSEYHPVASNDTPVGRSQNRRIEIALLPDAP